MKKTITILLIFLMGLPLYAQEFSSYQKVWDKSYGESTRDHLEDMIKIKEGGFLLGGYAIDSINKGGDYAFRVIKTDSAGYTIWNKTWGGEKDDKLYSLMETSQGDFILAGNSESGQTEDKSQPSRGGWDFWILKINAQGEKIWDKSYGGNEDDLLEKIIATSDGNYLLAGSSRSAVGADKSAAHKGDYDYWIIKIDPYGNKIWDASYGGNQSDRLTDILEIPDGGYLLGGYSRSDASGDKTTVSYGEEDFWIVKIDGSGNIGWDRSYGGEREDHLYALANATDEGFLLGGASNSEPGGNKDAPLIDRKDFWLVKIDGGGNIIWDQSYNTNSPSHFNNRDYIYTILPLNNGGYLLGGINHKSATLINRTYYRVVEIDQDGAVQWQDIFHGSPNLNRDDHVNVLADIVQVSPHNYLLGGTSWDFQGEDKTDELDGLSDFWVIKIAIEIPPPLPDQQPPVLSSIPMDTTVTCGNIPDPVQVTANDNIDGTLPVEFQEEKVPGECPSAYLLTRTWTARDAAGNVATASQVITIEDHTPPVFTTLPPESMQIYTKADDDLSCSVAVQFPEIAAADNCQGEVILTYSVGGNEVQSGQTFAVGQTEVTVSASDICGNMAQHSFIIEVVDGEPPLLAAQDLTINLDQDGQAVISVAEVYDQENSSDNCQIDLETLSLDRTQFSCDDLDAPVVVTLTGKDIYGNEAQVQATIIIEDNTPPVFTTLPPESMQIYTKADDDLSCSVAVQFPEIAAADNCQGEVILTYSVGENEVQSGQSFAVGQTEVTVTATDVSGNMAQHSFIIEVVDGEPPLLAAQDLTINLDQDGQAVISVADVFDQENSSDNCQIDLETLSLDHTQFSCDDLDAPVIVTLTGKDIYGNEAQVQATIIIEDELNVCAPGFILNDCRYALQDFGDAAEITAYQEVDYAHFKKKRKSYVIGIATGYRQDGQAGVWELHNDCTVHPVFFNGQQLNSSLLPDIRGLSREYGWKYEPYSISSDGKFIYANAVNHFPIPNKYGWKAELGTSIAVKYSMGRAVSGRIFGIRSSIECNDLNFKAADGELFVISCDYNPDNPSFQELVGSILDKLKFYIHPNPFRNKFSIKFAMEARYETLRLFDAVGKEVYFQNVRDLNALEVDLSHIPLKNGFYYLQLSNNQEVKSFKLMRR
ncbi:MAG: T9SS type A sorting domain-containing protein [Candidatus Cyclobacteriaceae bacterium M3_2C_046]